MRYLDFINDDEKMRDFFKLSKNDFLSSYSYLSEDDYDETKKIVDKSVILELIYEGKDNWERPVYKSEKGVRYKDVELGEGINLKKSLYTVVENRFDGEPLAPLQYNVIPKVLHYVPIKELTGNKDLKEICKKIKFYEEDLLPEDIKRNDFIKEIKIEIEWQLDMVSPNVNKWILEECYKEILKIERNENISMKEYEKLIDKNNILQNELALTILLEKGRENLLDDKYFEEMIKNVGKNEFMTPDFQKNTFEISRKMAGLKTKELCDYIHDKVKADRKREMNRY